MSFGKLYTVPVQKLSVACSIFSLLTNRVLEQWAFGGDSYRGQGQQP